MSTANPSPQIGKDGQAVPSYSALIAARDGSNLHQDLTTETVGSKQPLHTILLDGSGNQITSVGGGTQYTEDAAAASDPVGNMSMAVRADSLGAVTNTDGDNIALRATNKGELYVKQTDAVPITDNSGSITVDYATTGSGTATGALRVELPTNGTGVIATVGAVTAITNALPAGTNAIGKLAANSGVDIGDVDVTSAVITGGAVAHDGADSGNPIKVGGRAINAEIAPVANNDRTDFVTDLTGKQIIMPFCNPENIVSGVTSAMTGTTSTSVISAPASGLRNYITSITVGNSHATVGTFVNIQDGNGGTTIWTIPAAAVYGGATLTFNPPLKQPTTATAIYCACVTTGSNTIVAINGYKGA